jgi:hypothetical protein
MTNLHSFLLSLTILGLTTYGNYKLYINRARILKTTFGKVWVGLVVFISFFTVLITAILSFGFLKSYWQDDRLKTFYSFHGVTLGWTKDEVLFRKGSPTSVSTRRNQERMVYPDGVHINLTDGKVGWIAQDCSGTFFYEKFGGVTCNDSLDKLIDVYGNPKTLDVSNDKLSRLYCYSEYNLCFEVTLSKVSTIFVASSEKGNNGVSYVPAEELKKMEEEKAQLNKKIVPDTDLPDNLKQKNKNSKIDQSGTDHCAPNLSKEERLRRLALKGPIRETGFDTFSNSGGSVQFSYGTLISCY